MAALLKKTLRVEIGIHKDILNVEKTEACGVDKEIFYCHIPSFVLTYLQGTKQAGRMKSSSINFNAKHYIIYLYDCLTHTDQGK